MISRVILLLLLCQNYGLSAFANSTRLAYQDCAAFLRNDSLVLQNSQIKRSFKWNQGHLMTLSLQDCIRKTEWNVAPVAADCFWPGAAEPTGPGLLQLDSVAATTRHPGYLQVAITASFVDLQIKRTFRLYPNCPAIACDYHFKGRSSASWLNSQAESDALESIEYLCKFDQTPRIPVLDRLALSGRHWRISAIRFYDRTDVNNNLVEEQTFVPFLKWRPVAGNILYAENQLNHQSVFMLKEAPCSDVQLAYPGADFLTRSGEFLCVGPGITANDLQVDEWVRGYSVVVGVASAETCAQMQALRTYQDRIRIRKPGRDLMIMMNTWGDRNRDARLGEAFAIKELEAGYRLGISHFQLDDGWQSGISKNSAFGQGTWQDNWTRSDYWQVNPQKFPNGLAPVIKRGKELGIEICLWFNPSSQDQYKNWQADAEALIALYKTYGIRTFKIDGLSIPDKQSEIHFRNFLERIMAATDEEAVFNLDVTAGRRFGYHYFTEYGNLFLENRYTDWANYYPHWTLRNVWMLSRYLPPQSLQIEFLNKWRNENKYLPADPLAPLAVPFDYLFAITMVGQPLAWFEASGLPEQAFAAASQIKTFRSIQPDLHACQIFPIGKEPSGSTWTGFQALAGKHGYLLIYRENHPQARQSVSTLFTPGEKVRCRAVLGQGKDFKATVDQQGQLSFTLPHRFSFCLYRYSIQ